MFSSCFSSVHTDKTSLNIVSFLDQLSTILMVSISCRFSYDSAATSGGSRNDSKMTLSIAEKKVCEITNLMVSVNVFFW